MKYVVQSAPILRTASRRVFRVPPDVIEGEPPEVLYLAFNRAAEGPWQRRGIAPDTISEGDGVPALRRYYYRECVPRALPWLTGRAAQYAEALIPMMDITAAPIERPIVFAISLALTPLSEGLARAAFRAALCRSSAQDVEETAIA